MAAAAETLSQAAAVRFERILVATDFSESSVRSIPYVLELAKQYGSEVFLAHAMPLVREPIPLERLPEDLDPVRAQAERRMKDLIQTCDVSKFAYHAIIENGPPAKVITWMAERENVDLLVLGTHGRSGIGKLTLGSVAEEVLRLVPVPVLTIGQHVPPTITNAPRFERILFATDFGAGAAKALPFALALVEKYGARLILLHIVPPITIVDDSPSGFGGPVYLGENGKDWVARKKQESVRKLLDIMPAEAKLPHAPEYLVETDSAAEGILIAASTNRVDLIVMGVHNVASPRAAAHAAWSVIHQVISKARCPVLTVRG